MARQPASLSSIEAGLPTDYGAQVALAWTETGARLVGRDAHLAELDATLGAAELGHGALVLLVGEPGIGKTALADEFGRRAVERGATLTWGRAWEAGGAPPFWPWIEVLRGLPLEVDSGLDAVKDSVAVVAELVPELANHVPDVAPPALEPAQARFRLFDAVSTLLRWASRDRPLVVVLDDLHAADPATLSLLSFVTQGVRRARVVLVGAFRDVEGHLTPAVATELSRVEREGRYLPLGRLDRLAVAHWADARGVNAPVGVLDQLYERSEGNPLFLEEMARLMRARGALEPTSDDALVPDSVRDVIRARMKRLSAPCLATLEVAAALGRTAELRILAAACGASVDDVSRQLTDAIRAEVIATSGRDYVRFTHILLRDVLHDGLTPVRRAALHAAVAAALVQFQAPLAEIVHHMFDAVPATGATEAIAWARRAARASLDQLAFEEAAAFLERALGELPNEATTQRCDLLLEVAGARIGAGDGVRGREAALAAAAIARELGEPQRLALAALRFGDVFTYAAVNSTLVELLEEALTGLPSDDGELRARLLGRLASALQPAADPCGPMVMAREALSMARQLDEGVRLAVFQSATSALIYFAAPAERIALDHEMLELAARRGDRLRELRAHLRLVFDYLEHEDAVRADACIGAYEALARDIGHPTYTWYSPLLRSARALMRGDFDEADELVAHSQSIAARSEEPNRTLTFTLHRFAALLISGRDDALGHEGSALGRVVAERMDGWVSGPIRALIASRLGQVDQARAALAAAYDPDFWQARDRMAAAWIAQTAVALGDRNMAAHAAEHTAPLAARNHCIGLAGCACLGPLAHPLGMALALLERWDEAQHHFDDALARADRLGFAPIRAQIELDYATALARRGAAADRDRAQRLLDSAHATADRLGMSLVAERCAAVLADVGPSPVRPDSVPSVPRAVEFELVRDAQMWTIAWGRERFRLKDSRGLQILDRLIRQPGREIDAVDLLAPPGSAGLVQDAGDVLDATAIASYRRRVHDLREELAEAERWNDTARAERVRDELEFLHAEISRAVGLGGRPRKAASTNERARVNARRRIVHALEKIDEQCPELARHLRWAVSTGYACAYYPDGPPH